MKIEEIPSITLDELVIKSFRGFRRPTRIPLGRITLLHGSNGLGKTTVFDAIDWTMFGEKWRLGGGSGDATQNLWQPQISDVSLATQHGSFHRIDRHATFAGRAFEAIQLAIDPTIFGRAALATQAAQRLLYLAQDEIRDIVTSESGHSLMMAALSGVPYATLFDRNAKNTLSDIELACRAATGEAEALSERLVQLRQDLENRRLKEDSTNEVRSRIEEFVQEEKKGEPLARLKAALDLRLDKLRGELQSAAEQARKFDQLRTALMTCGDEVAKAKEQLDITQRQAALASKNAASLDASLQAADEGCDDARATSALFEKQLTKLENDLQTAKKANSELVHRQSLESRSKALRADLTNLEADEAVSGQEVAKLRVQEQQARARFAQSKELAERRNELSARLKKLMTKVNAASELLDNRTSLRKQLSLEIEETTRTSKSIANEIERERKAAGRIGTNLERLSLLVQELSENTNLHDGVCPLCSHEHGTAQALEGRIEQTLNDLRVRSRSVQQVSKLNQEIVELSEQESELRSKLSVVALEVQSTQESIESDRQELSRVEDITATLPAPQTDQEMAAAEAEQDEANAALMKAIGNFQAATSAREQTQAQLEHIKMEISSASVTSQYPPLEGILSDLEPLQRRIADVISELATARATVGELEERSREFRLSSDQSHQTSIRAIALLKRANDEHEVWLQELSSVQSRCKELGLAAAPDELRTELSDAVDKSTASLHSLRLQIELGEGLSETVSGLLTSTESAEIEKEIKELELALSANNSKLAKLSRAKVRLGQIKTQVDVSVEHEAVRSVTSCQSTIDAVMNILSPHRHLNTVVLGKLGGITLRDEELSRAVSAKEHSSTAQLNCVALAVFLGIAISSRASRLRCILLDEPIQNLDDVNLLNFLDLLRHLAKTHQVILSTANPQIADLLSRKFAVWALAENQSVVLHEFRDFDRETGPVIRTRRSLVQRGRTLYEEINPLEE